MDHIPSHVDWLEKTDEHLATADGKRVEIWEFHHQPDDEVLSEWARHFRHHYCLDHQIDELVEGTKYRTRTDFLIDIKFPDEKKAPGPSIRAGDFGEILVADFLEFILGYWVPRTRYVDKDIRNESTKGCDIIGFKIIEDGKISPKDALAIFESKTQFSGRRPLQRLQDAIDGSHKDYERQGESLNAIKQRYLDLQEKEAANKVKRFQNLVDRPFRELYGAAALFSSNLFNRDVISTATTQNHKKHKQLKLVVIRGDKMMDLVHKLYRIAADEA